MGHITLQESIDNSLNVTKEAIISYCNRGTGTRSLTGHQQEIIDMRTNTKNLGNRLIPLLLIGALSQAALAQDAPPPLPLGFFVTSVGLGDGANLGGLAGADAHCQALAKEVGAGDRVWRAYLSTQATDSKPAVNARDRIGDGPWGNAKGLEIATNIDILLYDNSNINYEHALTEKGTKVNSGVHGDSPNKHDILTGTQLDGTAYPAGDDMTCSNWTSNDAGKAQVGHADRYRFTIPGGPWNSAHPSRGCSQKALQASGGDGLFYCFASDQAAK